MTNRRQCKNIEKRQNNMNNHKMKKDEEGEGRRTNNK